MLPPAMSIPTPVAVATAMAAVSLMLFRRGHPEAASPILAAALWVLLRSLHAVG